MDGVEMSFTLNTCVWVCIQIQKQFVVGESCCMPDHVLYGVVLSAVNVAFHAGEHAAQSVLIDIELFLLADGLAPYGIGLLQDGLVAFGRAYHQPQVTSSGFGKHRIGVKQHAQREVERMVDAVLGHHFHGLDVPVHLMAVLKVGTAVHAHHHAGRKRVLGQVQCIQVDMIEIEAEIGYALPVAQVCLHTGVGLEQTVVAV